MSDSDFEWKIKVVIVGDTSVGKTSIIERFSKDHFSEATVSTFGCTAVEKQMKRAVDGKEVSLCLWDTAGQERYRSLSPVYFRESSFAVATLDVTKEESLDAVEFWINQYHSVVGDSGKVVIAANKSETLLSENERNRMQSKIERRFKLKTFMVSAKDNFGIGELFQYIVDSYTPSEPEMDDCETETNVVDIDERVREMEANKKSCC